MNATVDEPAAPEPGYEASLGDRLRVARLAADLSIEEVSTQLHLNPGIIEKLESDDYAELSAPTFVRGYLKSYARVLKLPAEPLIEAFDRRGLNPPELIADIATHSEARSGDFWVVASTVAIVSLLVVLAALWFKDERRITPAAPVQTAPRTGPREVVPATPAPIPLPAQEKPAGEGPLDTVGDRPAESAATPAPSEPPPAPGPTTPAGRPPADSIGAVPEDAPPAAPTPLGEPAASDAHDVVATVSPVPAADRGTVALSFGRDAWVELYDADGTRLFYDLARAGRRVEVTGRPPIRVLLGYVQGVKIEYNGELFDFSPYVSKGIARFELGR